ncbi:MAG TPA: acyltransferase [Candidatus Methylacidiphilales bacterium]|jgi:peptidoglycan/LPS O-acetylase OafA/YrhL|nr:acyltransferase [Candidatus Methylacidiphilales bacterium]
MAISSVITPDLKAEAPRQRNEQVKSTYYPHLDGLRALAILGILFEHLDLPLPVMLRCGPLSVRFFFVLTGYFITLSLWRVRGEMADSNEGYMPLGRYYLARLLRTGPPFYLSLLIGALFGIEEVRSNFFWLATFQANNYIAWLGYWPDAISHYWSLAVQEQFYFLWPLIVLTLPRRWFFATMAGFILFGLGFRIVCIVDNSTTLARWVTLFGCIDSFAVGALVAYLRQSKFLDRMWQSKTLLFAMPLAAGACFFLGRALMTLPEGNVWLALTESVDAVFLAWVLAASLTGMQDRYARILSWEPLVYLGKISYGVYVYHVFIIVLVSPLLASLGMTEDHNAFARIAILLAVTFAVASFSWHWIEQPFLAWKAALTSGRKRVPVVPEPVREVSFAS